MNIKLLKHQYDFIHDTTSEQLLLVGGLGSGKSKALIYKAIYMATLNIGWPGMIVAPTYGLIKDIIVPGLVETLEEMGITYSFNQQQMKFTLQLGKATPILLRSAEKPKRIIGTNIAWGCIDEIDVLPHDQAKDVVQRLQARIRTPDGTIKQLFAATSPEGFKFAYNFWIKEVNEADTEEKLKKVKGRKIIHATSYDNIFLPKSFFTNLENQYPPNLLDAYLNGKFVNLTSGTVYHMFNRALHNTSRTLDSFNPTSIIHIGIDFNIAGTNGTVFVLENGIMYAIDEIIDVYDTTALIEEIRYRFPKRTIYVYPDASGVKRTTNAQMSDLQLLKQAGLKICAFNNNPFIKDRVAAVNMAFSKNKVFINTKKCKTLTNAVEQQAFKNGQPEKGILDGYTDSFGYAIYFHMPIGSKPTIRTN